MSEWSVTVPRLPSPELNINRHSGKHWSTRSTAKREDTDDAMACCLSVGRKPTMPWSAVAAHVHFVVPYVKSATRRDWDNLIGSLKGFWDGIVHALVLTDDSMQVIQRLSFSHEFKQGHDGATTFTFTRLEG